MIVIFAAILSLSFSHAPVVRPQSVPYPFPKPNCTQYPEDCGGAIKK